MILQNEIDSYAVEWLRNLSDRGHIPHSIIDNRSISELDPSDVLGFDQVHFFAGIGGWSLALKMAGWEATRPVWTGSCPCQPFSSAGKQKAEKDQRHLWPEFRRLISQCLPPVIFGEQVASKLGREWLSGVRVDLEKMGYVVGAADLCAASIGAPHIRQRIFWGAKRLAHPYNQGLQRRLSRRSNTEREDQHGYIGCNSSANRVANTNSDRRSSRSTSTKTPRQGDTLNTENWSSIWHSCLDGKTRRIPTQSEFFPLVNGVSNRVGRIRAYGNAIVPQIASVFITSFMEV